MSDHTPSVAGYWDWDVCYACNGAGYFDGGDMRDDETCHTCNGRGGVQVWVEAAEKEAGR